MSWPVQFWSKFRGLFLDVRGIRVGHAVGTPAVGIVSGIDELANVVDGSLVLNANGNPQVKRDGNPALTTIDGFIRISHTMVTADDTVAHNGPHAPEVVMLSVVGGYGGTASIGTTDATNIQVLGNIGDKVELLVIFSGNG